MCTHVKKCMQWHSFVTTVLRWGTRWLDPEAYWPAIPTKTSYRFNIYCFRNYSREIIEKDTWGQTLAFTSVCMEEYTHIHAHSYDTHTSIPTSQYTHTHTPHTHICACICSPPHRQEKNTLNINIKERQTPP